MNKIINWVNHKLKIRKYVKMVRNLIVGDDFLSAMNYVPATYYDEVYRKVLK